MGGGGLQKKKGPKVGGGTAAAWNNPKRDGCRERLKRNGAKSVRAMRAPKRDNLKKESQHAITKGDTWMD